MLPSNLLRVKISKGKIRPIYATLDSGTIQLAESITNLYKSGVGRKKGELAERLKEVENQGNDFKLTRGLSMLLERRCLFEAETALNPAEARKVVFGEASRVRATSAEEKEGVLQRVSTELRVSRDALERSIFSDVDDELILRDFKPLQGGTDALLRYYNLAVTQTLLFKALRVEFTASDNWKNIFRDVKWLGLIYSVERPNTAGSGGATRAGDIPGQRFKVSLEGPLSLFKMTERYGTAIAKLLPQIAASKSWSIKAEILARSRGGKVYDFEIESEEAKGLIADVRTDGDAAASSRRTGQSVAALSYDSATEANFASAFLSFGTGWALRREPEPLIAGPHVLIPDFVFENNGMRVYLEVVGFWTPEYLKRKIAKLSSLSGVDMIVAADESLACSKLEALKGKAHVIYYKRNVPIKPIIDHLRRKEEAAVREQVERIKGEGGAAEILLSGDVVSIDELARLRGVSVESMKVALQDFAPGGYARVGDRLFVSKTKLREIDGRLRGVQTLKEALAAIEASGVKEEGSRVLEAIGYTPVWDGLEMDKVRISKRETSAENPAAEATPAVRTDTT